jgi:hypothetical protein
MKKLLAMLVLLMLLGLCVPSFGNYVLIYRCIISGKALNVDENTLSSGKMKAFLVIEIDDGCEPGDYAFIGDASLVLYDRVPGPKYYAELDNDEGPLEVSLTLTPEPGNEDLAAIELWQEEGTYWCAMLTGKLKVVDVGLGGKSVAPTSLSGRMVIDGSFFDQADLMGSADIVANLDKSLTKKANQAEMSVWGVVFDTGGIIDILEHKGFVNID